MQTTTFALLVQLFLVQNVLVNVSPWERGCKRWWYGLVSLVPSDECLSSNVNTLSQI